MGDREFSAELEVEKVMVWNLVPPMSFLPIPLLRILSLPLSSLPYSLPFDPLPISS